LHTTKLKKYEKYQRKSRDKMKELIHHIVDIIRKNATVDWSKRSDVRAKLRLTVKKY
jgi:type I restriction enzyme, R subunit